MCLLTAHRAPGFDRTRTLQSTRGKFVLPARIRQLGLACGHLLFCLCEGGTQSCLLFLCALLFLLRARLRLFQHAEGFRCCDACSLGTSHSCARALHPGAGACLFLLQSCKRAQRLFCFQLPPARSARCQLARGWRRSEQRLDAKIVVAKQTAQVVEAHRMRGRHMLAPCCCCKSLSATTAHTATPAHSGPEPICATLGGADFRNFYHTPTVHVVLCHRPSTSSSSAGVAFSETWGRRTRAEALISSILALAVASRSGMVVRLDPVRSRR